MDRRAAIDPPVGWEFARELEGVMIFDGEAGVLQRVDRIDVKAASGEEFALHGCETMLPLGDAWVGVEAMLEEKKPPVFAQDTVAIAQYRRKVSDGTEGEKGNHGVNGMVR